MRSILAMTVLSFALGVTAPIHAGESCNKGVTPTADILQTAAGAGSFKSLLTALIVSGLDDALKGPGPFTVFAPSDKAFGKLPEGVVAKLLLPENKQQLVDLLKLHVVSGKVSAAQLAMLAGRGAIETLNGAALKVEHANHKLQVGNATVIKGDIVCRNGIIHVIDEVLMPPTPVQTTTNLRQLAEKSGKFSLLLAAVEAAGLTSALEGTDALTVLAPTDEAFRKLPKATLEKLLSPEGKHQLVAILKYHIISGKVTARNAVIAGKANTLQGTPVEFRVNEDGRLAVKNAQVLAVDLKATNGIVHVIDTVLIP